MNWEPPKTLEEWIFVTKLYCDSLQRTEEENIEIIFKIVLEEILKSKNINVTEENINSIFNFIKLLK